VARLGDWSDQNGEALNIAFGRHQEVAFLAAVRVTAVGP
jgi:hypothetical protein